MADQMQKLRTIFNIFLQINIYENPKYAQKQCEVPNYFVTEFVSDFIGRVTLKRFCKYNFEKTNTTNINNDT